VSRPFDKYFGRPKIIFVLSAESISANVQDYTKAVYALEARRGEPVSTNQLAERLGVTAGSVSGMVRKLAELGLVEHEPYRGVRLTDQGRRVALEVLRHHRLIELFLAEELGMSWDRVHDEAEVLEHVLSEDLERLISARLGEPSVDPHGDPIPTPELDIDEGQTASLEELPAAATGRFVRVSDSDPEMLRYLAECGIALGDRLEVTGRQPFGGPVFVRAGGRELPLGGQLARAMRIELQESGGGERMAPHQRPSGAERPQAPARVPREVGR
jgi:DtxR family Mn-dependent transcriptional regulator